MSGSTNHTGVRPHMGRHPVSLDAITLTKDKTMQASEHNAVKEVIALRNSIHDLALEIIDNDYDADKLTSQAMSLILDWADPVHADNGPEDWECNTCS